MLLRPTATNLRWGNTIAMPPMPLLWPTSIGLGLMQALRQSSLLPRRWRSLVLQPVLPFLTSQMLFGSLCLGVSQIATVTENASSERLRLTFSYAQREASPR